MNMASPTTPAIIHNGDWNEESRQHPAFKIIEDFNKALDNDPKTFGERISEWWVADYTWRRPDGTKYNGATESWKYWSKTFDPLKAIYHQPEHMVVTPWSKDGRQGYNVMGNETTFIKFAMDPSEEELKSREFPKSRQGDTYDWTFLVYVRYELVEDDDGELKFLSETNAADVFPCLQMIVQRGMMPASNLIPGHSDVLKREIGTS